MTNLVIKQGADQEIRIPNIRDANGVLIPDLAGYTVRAQVRDRPEATTVLHEWSTAAGSATTSGSDIVLALAAATSTAWTWTHGRYDVELTNPLGKSARVAEGHIILSREVTRS